MKLKNRKLLVISAVNLVEGGTLTILRDCISAAEAYLPSQWHILVFVNSKSLVKSTRSKFIEIPSAKKSWLRRFWVEWVLFGLIAKKVSPTLWLSLHDVTPNVGNTKQAVYCHNPMPFFHMGIQEAWLEPKLVMFWLFYKIIYRIGIKKNSAIFVQQDWIRNKFIRWAPNTNIIVTRPFLSSSKIQPTRLNSTHNKFFIYPTFPRVFKNIELVCEAARILELNPLWTSRIAVTICGNENRYANWIIHKYGSLKSVAFIGRQDSAGMQALYAAADCLLFPSRLETWGLPISEAISLGLPILASDLPYAHEVIGSYRPANFFNPTRADELAKIMLDFQSNNQELINKNNWKTKQPSASNWEEFIKILQEIAL